MTSSEENKYIKQVYNMMLNDLTLQPLKQNWASCVKDLLSRLGFLEVWESQGVGNIQAFLNMSKQRLRDVFTQDWHSWLRNSTSEKKRNLIFANFQYQKYLDILNIVKYRKSLSRLRLSSQRLEVKVGRWVKPNKVPYGNIKCKICNVLEDEFHFCLECPLYAELRNKYISNYNWCRPNNPKFIHLYRTL